MTLIFILIFLLSIAGGAAWGYINNLTVAGYIISLAVAGFVGSSIIASVFTYLYFYQKGTEEERENETKMPGLKNSASKEIKRLKK